MSKMLFLVLVFCCISLCISFGGLIGLYSETVNAVMLKVVLILTGIVVCCGFAALWKYVK